MTTLVLHPRAFLIFWSQNLFRIALTSHGEIFPVGNLLVDCKVRPTQCIEVPSLLNGHLMHRSCLASSCPSTGGLNFSCPSNDPNGSFCNGESLSTSIIVDCEGGCPSPGNCNDQSVPSSLQTSKSRYMTDKIYVQSCANCYLRRCSLLSRFSSGW